MHEKNKDILFLKDTSILPWKGSFEYSQTEPKLLELGFTKPIEQIKDIETFDTRIAPYRIRCDCSRYLVDIVFADIANLNKGFTNIQQKILFDGTINIYCGGKIPGTSFFGHNLLGQGKIRYATDNTCDFNSEKGLANLILGIEQKDPIKRIQSILQGYNIQEFSEKNEDLGLFALNSNLEFAINKKFYIDEMIMH